MDDSVPNVIALMMAVFTAGNTFAIGRWYERELWKNGRIRTRPGNDTVVEIWKPPNRPDETGHWEKL